MAPTPETYLDLATLQELASRWGASAGGSSLDAAQVVANYLACHPRVEGRALPGASGRTLTSPRAANTLVGGFGPRVAYRAAGEWRLWEADGRDARDQVMELEAALGRR